MHCVCRGGAALGALVALGCVEHLSAGAALWLSYMSVRSVGGQWYGFAWEPQFTETAFFGCILLCPLLPAPCLRCLRRSGSAGGGCARALSRLIVRACFGLLLFRIMCGAGLLKLRARDGCWRARDAGSSCLQHHYENQPMPNPLSWFAHHLSLRQHAAMQTFAIDACEVAAPCLLMLALLTELALALVSTVCAPLELVVPRRAAAAAAAAAAVPRAAARAGRHAASLSTLVLMLGIQATGNYSFLNVTTAVPCLPLLDDRFYRAAAPFLFRRPRTALASVEGGGRPRRRLCICAVYAPAARAAWAAACAALLFVASAPGLQWLATGPEPNLATLQAAAAAGGWPAPARAALATAGWVVSSPAWRRATQWAVRRLAPLSLANEYASGRFAHMTRKREEVVLWALHCPGAGAGAGAGVGAGAAGDKRRLGACLWVELAIPCKPGAVDRRPCLTAPYHRRMAWQFWFLPLAGPRLPPHDPARPHWLRAFAAMLLEGRAHALQALEHPHPFTAARPPLAVEARLYRQ
eukprot:g1955.t1